MYGGAIFVAFGTVGAVVRTYDGALLELEVIWRGGLNPFCFVGALETLEMADRGAGRRFVSNTELAMALVLRALTKPADKFDKSMLDFPLTNSESFNLYIEAN